MNNVFDTKLFSPAEARGFLGIGKNKIYELIKQGKIEYINMAGKYRITEEAIKDFLLRNTVRPSRPRLYQKPN